MSDQIVPLVCICIPTYNSEKTIRKTLLSITGQTYHNLMIRVVDNASTDGTVEVVEEIGDSRVTIHKHKVNVGAEGNFNRCIEIATGTYTAIYHADDIYETRMVEKQVAFLENNPAAGGVFTEASLIDEAGMVIGEIRQPQGVALEGPSHGFRTMFKAILKNSNFLICPSFMARTTVYQQEIKTWRGELFGSSADLDVWFRVLQRHPCGILPERLMRYRIGSSQFSAAVRLDTKRADFFRVIDHYLQQSEVSQLIDQQDVKNYARLDRRDRVMRAVNALLKDQPDEAVQLCYDVVSPDAIAAAFQTRRGLITLFLGLYVKISITLGLTKFAKTSLTYMKWVANK